MPGLHHRAARRLAGGARRWWAIAVLLPHAGIPAVVACFVLNILLGTLPVAFAVGTSIMISRLGMLPPGAGDLWSVGLRPALTALGAAVVALVLQNLLAPLHAGMAELIGRRIDGVAVRRLMTATLTTAPLETLEDETVLDRLSEIRTRLLEWSATPGAAAAALFALVARYTQLLSAAVVICIVLGPWYALIAVMTALLARAGSRGSLGRFTAFQRSRSHAFRKVEYLWRTASDPALAKDARVLGALDWWIGRARSESDAYYAEMWRERRRVYFAPYLWLSAVVLVGAGLLLGSMAGRGPELTVLEFTLAVQAVLVPMRFGTYFPEADIATEFGMAAWEAILEVEERFGAPAAAPAGDRALSAPHESIRMEGVSFHYEHGGRPVLENLDLELKAGTSTAIVGINGAGKTTLVKLLAGLYEPRRGRITVDGVPLTELDRQTWRRRLAVIFQDFVRYEFDAGTNIALGAPHVPAESDAIWRAALRADADQLLRSLPHQLTTPLSSRYPGGRDLSGGQWQRVALARALYAVGAGAGVLILDEPTAQLDVRAEVDFYDRFLDLTHGLTTVVISHRFSTVRRADRIVVLEGGRVGEQGTHDELMALGGRYATLFHLQARRFGDAETADASERS